MLKYSVLFAFCLYMHLLLLSFVWLLFMSILSLVCPSVLIYFISLHWDKFKVHYGKKEKCVI